MIRLVIMLMFTCKHLLLVQEADWGRGLMKIAKTEADGGVDPQASSSQLSRRLNNELEGNIDLVH